MDDRLRQAVPTDVADLVDGRVLAWFERLGGDGWIPLSLRFGGSITGGVHSAIAPIAYRPEALASPEWDLTHGMHGPGFVQEGASGARVARYVTLPTAPVEPILLDRAWDGLRPGHQELTEEFRLFHNLWPDTGGRLFTFDGAGNAVEAAQVDGTGTWVRTALVRQYLAARQMDLLLFVDAGAYGVPEDGLPLHTESKTEVLCARFDARVFAGDGLAHLLGTRVIAPGPIESCGIWPFDEHAEEYPAFIIGATESGEPIRASCNPRLLANGFGANPGQPDYLTPVHFRRDVLAKYYDRPDIFTVEDGYLRCAARWGLRIDNDAADIVSVWLGDLGEYLPEEERPYWLAFNIPPDGPMSESAIRRQLLGQFADSQSADLRFRSLYRRVVRRWQEVFGWPLYLPPEPGDARLLEGVRRPLHDADTEFEELVLVLTRLVVDSLNERELVREIGPGLMDERGISKLERWLTAQAYEEVSRDITFLKGLQAIRSQGAAHRKGSEWDQTLTRVLGGKRGVEAGDELLQRAVAMLTGLLDLAEHARPPAIGSAGDEATSG
ncbi:MAG TPA: hypothetical protein VGK16_05500 [Candidatus Limnocylindrales bacterium]|jgi:hypothetical protein